MARFHINFFLRSVSKDDKKTSERKKAIWADISYYGNRLRTSTKLSVAEKDWNVKKKEIRSSCLSAPLDNLTLSKFRNATEEIIRKNFTQGIILSSRQLKKEIFSHLYPKIQGNGKHNLLSYVRFFVENNPKKIKHSTMKSYKQLIPLLEQFSKKNGVEVLDFEGIDNNWYDEFIELLFKIRGHGNNNAGKHIKNIKAIMNYAYARGFHKNTNYTEFKKTNNKTSSIALSEEIIKKLYELPLTGTEEKVRDTFVFSCLTGLRFSDATSVKKHHIKGDNLEICTKKTRDDLVIPLRTTAKTILEKYDGNMPTFYNQKYNNALKKICAMIPELHEDVGVKKVSGNKDEEKVVKMYMLVQSHTARRSFATNMYQKGYHSLDIMAITGHKQERDFLTYIRMSQRKKVNRIAEAFKKLDF